MEQQQPSFPSITPPESQYNTLQSAGGGLGGLQFLLLFSLGTLLLLSFLGINIFTVLGNMLNWLNANLMPSVYGFFGMVSYSTGDLIVKGSDAAADAAKLGVDLAEGAAQSVGGIAKGLGEVGMQYSPELKTKYKPPHEPAPDTSASAIQTSGGKGTWCLVGDVKGVRNCLEVDKETKCASGQSFPDSAACLRTTPDVPVVKPPAPAPAAPTQMPLPVPMPMDMPISSNIPPPTVQPPMFQDAMVWNQNNVNRLNSPINQIVYKGEPTEAERQAQELLKTYM